MHSSSSSSTFPKLFKLNKFMKHKSHKYKYIFVLSGLLLRGHPSKMSWQKLTSLLKSFRAIRPARIARKRVSDIVQLEDPPPHP